MSQDITLLENVELKFALADTEAKFTHILNIFLCPILLKLDSKDEIVKRKVMAICSHINTRLKNNSLAIPCEDLVKLFASDVGNATRAFALIYIEMGIKRILDEEAAKLIPRLISGTHLFISGIHTRPASLVRTLFIIIISVVTFIILGTYQVSLIIQSRR